MINQLLERSDNCQIYAIQTTNPIYLSVNLLKKIVKKEVVEDIVSVDIVEDVEDVPISKFFVLNFLFLQSLCDSYFFLLFHFFFLSLILTLPPILNKNFFADYFQLF